MSEITWNELTQLEQEAISGGFPVKLEFVHDHWRSLEHYGLVEIVRIDHRYCQVNITDKGRDMWAVMPGQDDQQPDGGIPSTEDYHNALAVDDLDTASHIWHERMAAKRGQPDGGADVPAAGEDATSIDESNAISVLQYGRDYWMRAYQETKANFEHLQEAFLYKCDEKNQTIKQQADEIKRQKALIEDWNPVIQVVAKLAGGDEQPVTTDEAVADIERLQAELETLKNIGELWTSTNDSRNVVLIENADLSQRVADLQAANVELTTRNRALVERAEKSEAERDIFQSAQTIAQARIDALENRAERIHKALAVAVDVNPEQFETSELLTAVHKVYWESDNAARRYLDDCLIERGEGYDEIDE